MIKWLKNFIDDASFAFWLVVAVVLILSLVVIIGIPFLIFVGVLVVGSGVCAMFFAAPKTTTLCLTAILITYLIV